MARFGVKTLIYCAGIGMVGITLLLAVSASASPIPRIAWATFTSNTDGTISGLGITITYTGEKSGLLDPGPLWTPVSTFSGGRVPNPPPSLSPAIEEEGGKDTIDTLTFSKPVEDPVMAIWSLGSLSHEPPIQARFAFLPASKNWTIQSGGPSTEHHGHPLFVCPDDPSAVCGIEGNGTIMFHGTFSTISFQLPDFERFYGFTVGAPVPEPSTLLLLGSGVFGLAGVLRRKLTR
jgi:hypothetical protein